MAPWAGSEFRTLDVTAAATSLQGTNKFPLYLFSQSCHMCSLGQGWGHFLETESQLSLEEKAESVSGLRMKLTRV